MGNPGPMLSKNFLAVPQLDVDFCTEFLCVPCWGNHIPPDLVVAYWTSDVESTAPLDFLW